MTNEAGASLQCVAIRVVALDDRGEASPGQPMYVSDQLVKIDFNPDMEAGQEISNRGASGNLCVVYRTPDLLKRLTIELELCIPDPELEVLLSGGRVFYADDDPTDVVGFQYPPLMLDPTPNGISVEAWTRYIVEGFQSPNQPYMRWLFPRMFLRHGNRTIDINAMGNLFSGFAIENPSWGSGPLGDWDQDSGAVVNVIFDDNIPTPQIGLQKVPTAPGGAGAPADTATAGTPGEFTPQGTEIPADFNGMANINPNPSDPWNTGEYVVLGDDSHAYWDGENWQEGEAP